jgi:UDP-2,3-diacylglucosamine hydrolase
MNNNKSVFFLSDFHLGIPDAKQSLIREQKIVRFLNNISTKASHIFLVGDMFDFWFEYKYVVPKGFVRLLAKLAELKEMGVEVHVFHGNHDLWQFGYLEQEIGCIVHDKAYEITLAGKKFYIAHGDGIGPGQQWFKFILSIYRNVFFQRLFAFVHPYIGITAARWFSSRSRDKHAINDEKYLGDEKEFHVLFAKELVSRVQFDYIVLGHRHLPMEKQISDSCTLVNLGDWITHFTYAEFDGEKLQIKKFE